MNLSAYLGRILGIASVAVLVIGAGYILHPVPAGGGANQSLAAPTATPSAPTSAEAAAVMPVRAATAAPVVTLAPSTAPTLAAVPTSTAPALALAPASPTATESPPAAVAPLTTAAPGRATPTLPAGTRQAVEIVVKPGAVAAQVAARIAGPGATVVHGPVGGPVPPPAVADVQRRTWLVPVPLGSEQAALARAQQDPDVQSARLVRWPPLVLHPE